MITIPPSLRNITTREMVNALKRDGFRQTQKKGGHLIFRHLDGRRVAVSYHRSGDTFAPKTLKNMLDQARWTLDDLKRLKLIK